MTDKHSPTPTHEHKATEPGKIYEYCKCGAVRHNDDKDQWHICDSCSTGPKGTCYNMEDL